jgi:hypothetical protein
METFRSSANAPLLVVAIFAALLVAPGRGTRRLHCYKSRWLAILFAPAAKVESLILGQEVYAVYPEEP